MKCAGRDGVMVAYPVARWCVRACWNKVLTCFALVHVPGGPLAVEGARGSVRGQRSMNLYRLR